MDLVRREESPIDYDFKRGGVVNVLAEDVEKFDMAFLAEHFSIDRIGKTNAKFDRAVVSFVDDEKAVSYTGAVILIGEAVKEHCRSAWADGKPLVTLTPSVNGGLPEVTAELPPAGEGVSDGEAAPVGEAAKA